MKKPSRQHFDSNSNCKYWQFCYQTNKSLPRHVWSPAGRLLLTAQLGWVYLEQRHGAARSPTIDALSSCWASQRPDHQGHSVPLPLGTAGSHWITITHFDSTVKCRVNILYFDQHHNLQIEHKSYPHIFQSISCIFWVFVFHSLVGGVTSTQLHLMRFKEKKHTATTATGHCTCGISICYWQ